MHHTTLLLFAVAAGLAAEPAPLTPSQQALYDALVARDGAPPCATVEALSPTPVADLTLLAEEVTRPGWVGLRAADCLITRHAEAVTPQLQRWMVSPDTKGLALLVVQKIDLLPAPTAQDLAIRGLAGPHAASLRPRLARAADPDLRRLATEPSR